MTVLHPAIAGDPDSAQDRRRSRARPGGLIAALAIAAGLVGCGGKQSGDTTPVTEGASEGGSEGEAAEPSSGEMVPAETMDEINRSLARKRRIVSHCLATAVDNKELPRNSAGKITLEIVISPAGKAETVNVVRATLESKTLHECVIARVKEIQFPELSRPYPTSYTYGFEAM